MDKEFLEQFQMLAGVLEKMHTSINENKNEILKTQMLIENTVSKKISSLFDGYKLTHEKQYELEYETQELKMKIEALETRLSALEHKTA